MRNRLGLAFALVLTAYIPPAFAQDAPPPESPKAGDSKEAQDHFQRARTLYDEGDFALALIEFKRAYDLSPNYRVLYNIGQVNIQLFNYAAARRALEQYLEDGGSEITSGRKGQVEADLKMLRERTAYLSVSTKPVGADVAVDDVASGKAPFREPLMVNAGQRKIAVSKDGYVTVTRQVSLAGGDRQDVAIELTVAPTERVIVVPGTRVEKNYTPAIVGWTATGAFAITTVIVGAIALGKKNALDDLSNPGSIVTPQGKRDAEASATGYSLAADIFGVATLLAGAASVYFTLRPPTTSETTSKAPAVSFSPFGVRGTF